MNKFLDAVGGVLRLMFLLAVIVPFLALLALIEILFSVIDFLVIKEK